jgi:hypothetical protein
MRILFISILINLLTSCITPLPPCEGDEEQIYRCQSLRIQEEQLRRTRMIQINQNQQIWNDWNKKNVRSYGGRYNY